MSKKWPKIKLGGVMRQRKEFVIIDDLATYKRPRVQLHAQGIVLRDEVPGALIKTKKQQVCRGGEFLVAEIDAKVGGFGIVPDSLNGAIVSSHYFLFVINEQVLDRRFLDWYIHTHEFRDQVEAQGSTNYAAIRPSDVLGYETPLPPLSEQRRIVAKIDQLAAKLAETHRLKEKIHADLENMLRGIFTRLIEGARLLSMREIAPLVRRSVEINPMAEYPELGIRSFGKGTFHKPMLTGLEVGTKRLYRIEPGDLLFNNVFAWEGAVAVSKPEDVGRFGSHRFITCVPKPGVATPNFLSFFFLTPKGLEKLGEASPGGAGRNRTLGLETLAKIKVPIPPIEKQLWFDCVRAKVELFKRVQADTTAELDAFLPSILDKAFKREL